MEIEDDKRRSGDKRSQDTYEKKTQDAIRTTEGRRIQEGYQEERKHRILEKKCKTRNRRRCRIRGRQDAIKTERM